jgi:outer membrane protein assembly factor BamB
VQCNPLKVATGLLPTLLAVGCIGWLSSAAAQNAKWPQIGYDSGHTGYNPTENIINSRNVATLTKTATLATPGQVTEPIVIDGGIAYVNSIGANALYAFDIASGQQLWTFPGTNLDAARGIAVAGGKVFVTCAIDSQHAGLCALNAKTGKQLWSSAYMGNQSSPQSPPAVSGDVVYFEEFQTYGDWLTALDTKTGALLWQYGYCNGEGICDGLGPNAPAIGGRIAYMGCSLVSGLQGICAVNTANGGLAWATQLGGQPNGNQGYHWGDGSGNLMVEKGIVYANYMTVNCYQCNYTVDAVALNGSTGISIWDTPITPVLNNTYGPVGPPALHGKQLFSVLECCDADNDSGLVKLNANTGQVAWHTETPYWLSSSPSLVNDLAFVQCQKAPGTICAFDAAKGSLLWTSPDPDIGGNPPPAITGGAAYEVCEYNNVCVYAPQ